MMSPFHKILASTALSLAAVGLSSFYTNIHRYVWQKAKVAEGGEWLDDSDMMELFSDGKHIYAKVNRGQMRGCCKGAPIGTFLPWLPLLMACVMETLWVVAPRSTALGFFALLGFILMTGVSLIVGIVMLIRWEHPHRAALILLSTVFLLPFLTWLLFDGLLLGVLLH